MESIVNGLVVNVHIPSPVLVLMAPAMLDVALAILDDFAIKVNFFQI